MLKPRAVTSIGRPITITSSTTPYVRVLPASATSTAAGKPVQLITLPKRMTPTGPHIAIRLPQINQNHVDRPVFIGSTSSSISIPVSASPSL